MIRSCCNPVAVRRALAVALALLATPLAAQTIETIAGTGRPGNNGARGRALDVNIDQPFGLEIGPDGGLYVTEVGTHRIRRLDLTSGELTTVAGTGQKGFSGEGGLATAALLNEPYEVRFDSRGDLLFVDMQNHAVQRVEKATGRITTIAGTGTAGYGGDGGPATQASFRQPHSIALDSADNIYVADIGNHRIRRIDARTRVVETIAGTGEKKPPVDGGAARDKPMLGPRALFVRERTLWIALREGNSVWRLDLETGVIGHVAGTGKRGFTGDGGPATQATFDGPKGIAVDEQQRVYVVDTENQAIREIDVRTGQIRTVAGSGPQARGFGGDGGPATQAKMDRPHGICLGAPGTLYLGDTNNHRVRRVNLTTTN